VTTSTTVTKSEIKVTIPSKVVQTTTQKEVSKIEEVSKEGSLKNQVVTKESVKNEVVTKEKEQNSKQPTKEKEISTKTENKSISNVNSSKKVEVKIEPEVNAEEEENHDVALFGDFFCSSRKHKK